MTSAQCVFTRNNKKWTWPGNFKFHYYPIFMVWISPPDSTGLRQVLKKENWKQNLNTMRPLKMQQDVLKKMLKIDTYF